MAITTSEADQTTRTAVHAALTHYGYALFEVNIQPGRLCGNPAGCDKPADRALVTEFQDGTRATPLPACQAHIPDAALAVYTAYSDDGTAANVEMPLFRADVGRATRKDPR